jgi:hypothetical protein
MSHFTGFMDTTRGRSAMRSPRCSPPGLLRHFFLTTKSAARRRRGKWPSLSFARAVAACGTWPAIFDALSRCNKCGARGGGRRSKKAPPVRAGQSLGVYGESSVEDVSRYLSRPIGGGRMANLRLVYPPKMAPAVADAVQKKPRRVRAGQVRGMECPRIEDVPGVSESFASDRRAAGLRLVLSTGMVNKCERPRWRDGVVSVRHFP